ncbi:MAG: PKD domain-containing protein, partial [Muribaculaceae bacterium]|nr:PKD domain-containing protein [Muribaculaceae bacterium]
MKKALILTLAALAAWPASALTASFAAQEGETALFSCGFDSQDEMAGWDMAGWELITTPSLDQGDLRPFSSVNPSSTSSAGCRDRFMEQDEAMVSPEIDVPAGATLRFYAAFSELFGIWGHMEVSVLQGSDRTLLLNSFLWSQEDGNDGSRWVPFSCSLDAFAGKKVRIEFRFLNTSSGGDNVYVDDVTITVPDTSADAVINVAEGTTVHFNDMSEGATSWLWTFEGGEPATSTQQNPAVVYPAAGSYSVSLTVTDASGATATATRNAYVQVKAQTPVARIGLPRGTYMSPWTMCYVPLGVPVTFRDLSTFAPTEWLWTIPGTVEGTCTGRNATVTYSTAGTYDISLRAGNSAGSTIDEYRDAIQAGGSQYVWNITPEESASIEPIALGWYGNYGGSNWLGLGQFAEHFTAPAADAVVDCVQAYFAKTTHVAASADFPIEVSLCEVALDGAPGAVLATTSLPVSELVDGYYDYEPTTFTFDEPVTIEAGKEFFVVIGPFPNLEGDSYYDVDGIALYCSPRRDADAGGESTVWHFAFDEGPDYEYLTTGQWYAQDEELISLAVSPHMTFDSTYDGILDAVAAPADAGIAFDGSTIVAQGTIELYT